MKAVSTVILTAFALAIAGCSTMPTYTIDTKVVPEMTEEPYDIECIENIGINESESVCKFIRENISENNQMCVIDNLTDYIEWAKREGLNRHIPFAMGLFHLEYWCANREKA